MNNTEATLDGRKRVGFRNNINPTSSKADPAGCREMRSMGSGPDLLAPVRQESPSLGDFSLISLVPSRLREAAPLPHPRENFAITANLGGPGFDFTEGISKFLSLETWGLSSL